MSMKTRQYNGDIPGDRKKAQIWLKNGNFAAQ